MASTKKRVRITADVPAELRDRIRTASESESLSVGAYVTRVLEKHVPRLRFTGSGRLTEEALDAADRLRDELYRKYGEAAVSSADVIREMREQRSREMNTW
jgi:hypothetical protein